MSLLTTLPIKLAPATDDGISVTDGGSWAWSSWVTVIASTSTSISVAGIFDSITGNNVEREWQLGIGSAGNEVHIGTFRAYERSTNGAPRAMYMVPVPLDAIPAGSRLSVRTRQSGVSPIARQARCRSAAVAPSAT